MEMQQVIEEGDGMSPDSALRVALALVLTVSSNARAALTAEVLDDDPEATSACRATSPLICRAEVESLPMSASRPSSS
tara:strand:- start:1923 stop:2156 length:234 start_codon:yes stop_codon:yes gene_type:complete